MILFISVPYISIKSTFQKVNTRWSSIWYHFRFRYDFIFTL